MRSGVEPSCYRHRSDESGRRLDIYFRPQCGTNLGLTLEAGPDIRTVPAGTYDTPEWLDTSRPGIRHAFVRSRRNWGEPPSEVEVYERHFR